MPISKLLNFSLPTKPGQTYCLNDLPQDGLALLLSEVTQRHTGVVLAVTVDNLVASRLESAVKFFLPQLTVLNFPDWETLPYDHFSPHEDITSQRLTTLARLSNVEQALLLVPIATLMQRLAPVSYIKSSSLFVSTGEKLQPEVLRQNLHLGGYQTVSQVMSRGELAIRGSLVDVFPMGSDLAYRIDFSDDEVDSIRTFDPDTQRSIGKLEKIELLPAREIPLTQSAIQCFRQQWRSHFVDTAINCPLYKTLSQGCIFPGIEYYLPLFFPQTQSLMDYLPKKTLILQINDIGHAADSFWKEVNTRYEQLRYDIERPILPPNQLYASTEQTFSQLKNFPRILLKKSEEPSKTSLFIQVIPDLTIDHKLEQPLARLDRFLRDFLEDKRARILFCVESAGRREAVLKLLTKLPIKVLCCESWSTFLLATESIGVTVAPLEEGFTLVCPPLAVITETQLFGRVVQKDPKRTKSLDSRTIIRNLTELKEGDPVVHVNHGIGRYRGLQHLTIDEQENEFLIIEYAGQDKLYIPVASLDLISRYSGSDLDKAPLSQLGSEQWEKTKRKIAEQMRDVAAALLDIYARRAMQKGYAFQLPEEDYQVFSSQFPFTETKDQAKAIQCVIEDMLSERTMDRLICGDVGFGKTEVAMRAAFIAVQSNKQVAILVPTTLLAQQHYQNFRDRFAEWPVHIEMISRFRSVTEQKKILESLAKGTIDILIGTHRLLSKELIFPRLGLLIIDEEHRFGVQQKERLKSWRAEVDILSLTATPIPRTLNMALTGLRELSIIATPPARRLTIKTFVQLRNTHLIREAVLRELLRGGQVYFLHNQVDTIKKITKELAELIPEARIQVAHGQLPERELERIMADFYHQRFNVLVCTTIIETGIDVPSANTIIIDRADQFGLAQLHQLRGRVGRSHHQAYAYLMIPPKSLITTSALKRLEAFSSLDDLGAGFSLAMHDLEIRGAGEVLGEQQSGSIQRIGFSLYMELLEQTVDALKKGKEWAFNDLLPRGLEIDVQISALIPEDYLPDVSLRLVLYKRISNAKTTEELESLQIEMIDRFGLLPGPVKNLFQLAELKLIARRLGAKKIIVGSKGGYIEFNDVPNINSLDIVRLIRASPLEYKLEGPNRLSFSGDWPTGDSRLKKIGTLLQVLLGEAKNPK